MKLVVVEDNPVDKRLLRAVMEAAGHNVLTCPSAVEALAQIILERPDVVLVDLNLPGMSGLDLVRAIRADPEVGMTPVLAMTAYPHQYTSRESLQAGCSAWVIKPIEIRTLVDRLLALRLAKTNESRE